MRHLLTIAHTITRATVEMWTFDHGEDCDYRVTLGAALRMLHQWRRRLDAHGLTIGDAWTYRKGSSERIVLTVSGRQFEVCASTLASKGNAALCGIWRGVVIPPVVSSVQHPTEVDGNGFPLLIPTYWLAPKFWRRILIARGAVEPPQLDAVYALWRREQT